MPLANVQFEFETTYIPVKRPQARSLGHLARKRLLTIVVSESVPPALAEALRKYKMEETVKPLHDIRWDRISHFDRVLIYGNSSLDELKMMCIAIREYVRVPIIVVSDTCSQRSVNLQLIVAGADQCLPLNTPEEIIAAYTLGVAKRYDK